VPVPVPVVYVACACTYNKGNATPLQRSDFLDIITSYNFNLFNLIIF
jgi:hypothetical protein